MAQVNERQFHPIYSLFRITVMQLLFLGYLTFWAKNYQLGSCLLLMHLVFGRIFKKGLTRLMLLVFVSFIVRLSLTIKVLLPFQFILQNYWSYFWEKKDALSPFSTCNYELSRKNLEHVQQQHLFSFWWFWTSLMQLFAVKFFWCNPCTLLIRLAICFCKKMINVCIHPPSLRLS